LIDSSSDQTGFARYHQLLSLFTDSSSSWTVEGLTEALGRPKSSVYRVVRELVSAGYLESAAGARYRLGPAYIVADRVISHTDPLIVSGRPVLQSLIADVPLPCAAVLARLFGSRVVCVADARTAGSHAPAFERGRPMPINYGATSLAILAQTRGNKRERLLGEAGVTDPAQRSQLIARLNKIRKAGIAVTTGEVDTQLTGWAVPVRHRQFAITASLSVVCATTDITDPAVNEITAMLLSSAALIEKHMQLVFAELSQANTS
jgi:DNA-binding IclR family transcriptional regulator